MNIWEYAQKRLNEAAPSRRDWTMPKAFADKEKQSIDKAGSKRAEAVMDSPAIGQFEADDFVKLAMLCIDQTGIDVQSQKKIEKMINDALPESKNESPVGGGSQDGDSGDPENDSEVEETYG